jgi:bacterioferritin
MNSFEKSIVGGPSLGEAAAFIINLKKFAAAPPDETGELEGRFSVPVEQVLKILADLVRAEFETIYAYHVYAQSLRDLSHDSIADHFEEHAGDETDHADFLLKRMAVLGGPVSVPDLRAPNASTDPCEILRTMVRMEQEGIAGWKRLLTVVGDNPMKVTIEDYAAKEQEHLDDLWQLLPHEANRPVIQQKQAGAKLNPFRLMRKVAFDGDVNEWLSREQMMQQAQEQAATDYYKDRVQNTQAQVQQKDQELQGVQQQMEALQQQQQQMQQELDQSGQIQRQILDQARQVEQAATQAAASAHQTASASMLQAMQAQQEVMRHKGLTAGMQQAQQSWKDQLMQIAQTDPTQGAGAQVGMPASGPLPPAQTDAPTEGPPVESGPAGNMPGAEGNPAAPTPEGQAPTSQATSEPVAPEQTLSPATKQGSVNWDHFRKLANNSALIGGAIGAPIGAGLAYLTSRVGKEEGAQEHIDELEGIKSRGEDSFSQAMELVSAKMRQGALEAAHAHPAMATLAGAAAGASVGSGIGPMAARVPNDIQRIMKHLKK